MHDRQDRVLAGAHVRELAVEFGEPVTDGGVIRALQRDRAGLVLG